MMHHLTLANGGVIYKLVYINNDGDVCWGVSFELSIVSLSIQNLNYL